jgi:hypothetical protein
MKILSRSVIALLICLLVIAMLVSPVWAFSVSGGSVSRDEGYVGDEINIYGSWEATEGMYIYIYYELYNVDKDDWDYKKVRYDTYEEGEDAYYFDYDFAIPESCKGVHEIYICDDDDPDADVETLEFTVYPSIEIDKQEGPTGTQVEATGKGWNEDESEIEIRFYLKDPGTTYLDDEDYYVEVASKDIEVDDYGTWEAVTFKVPAASKGDHWIYAVGDQADDIEDDEIKGVKFEVTPGISVEPKQGSLGDTVTVTGSGFKRNEGSIQILFDGKSVATGIKADSDGVWTGTFEVPAAATGKYDITAQGADTPKADVDEVEFEVTPGLKLEPAEGHVGTSLTVSGSGFPAGKSVAVTYDGVSKGSATTDSKGSFSGISFEATHTQSTHLEKHPVVATYDSTTVSKDFVMEATAPAKPALSSPADGSRVGFVWKATPTFEWSAVTDPSGVSYSLEVSSVEDFAILAIPEVTGLTGTSYELPGEQGLAYGTYYWRVRAVDGAQNVGEWSEADSFKSGLLPLWAFIVCAALLAVLIGVLVYFFVRRGGSYD